MRRNIVLTAAAAIIIVIGTMSGTVHAYSITSGSSMAVIPILTPFENFFKSINSVSVVGPSIGVQSIPKNSFIMGGVQSGFQWFDNWLYGIAGFHISGLFTTILSVFSWLLGFVKGGVDWLLNVIH